MRCGFALSGVATLLAVMVALVSCKNSRPNIIVIIADDMGNNDVSFHGSDEIPTPNIDALAYNGVILNSHYTQALCTPSRAAFLTGKYPIHLGMQHIVILEPEPSGLPLNETLFPQHLKRHGYKTHAVGKWHLGFYKKEYTPTYRGFDSHYGYWQGFHDYYDHTVCATYSPECGYDMRNNMTVDWDAQGKYSTTLFTNEAVRIIKEHNVEDPMFMYLAHLAPHTGNDAEPLQAPDEEIAKFSYIADPERRIYAAMISMLDQSVGRVITALREKRMLENSIILFISDNGAKTIGIHANHGSNYPLRGLKTSTWEGAMRNVAAVWSPLIKRPQRVNNEVMHISDWMPTFYTAAGLNISELGKIDGVDMWRVISEGGNSPRQNFVYNIDDIWKYGAVRMGDYKYMYGSPVQGTEDRWFGSTGRDPNYKYTEEQILKSPAGVSFNGLTTHLQIKDVHSNKNSTITHTLLTAEKIKTLRKEATIDCLTPDDQKLPCNPITAPCLFNIKTDPCEKRNLASVLPSVFKKLETYYVEMRKGMRTPINTPIDPNADPVKWNGTWTNWMDAEEVYKMRISHQNLSPLAIGLITAACLAFFVIIVILFVISCKRSPKSKMNSIFAGLEDPMDSPAAAMNGRDREMRVVQIVNGRPHESH